jgi:hypothetical protein
MKLEMRTWITNCTTEESKLDFRKWQGVSLLCSVQRVSGGDSLLPNKCRSSFPEVKRIEGDAKHKPQTTTAIKVA